jgi:cell wall-associated NlpC family hydrolase
MRAMIVLAMAVLALGILALTGPAPKAGASARSTAWQALKWAEGKAGCWYSYGGTSCSQGYDCSGLVMSAFAHEGYSLPRTTEEMLASGRIYQVSWRDRRQGDLLFWGSSHVELVTEHGSFGAQQSGTRVGWHSLWGSPTVWRIR